MNYRRGELQIIMHCGVAHWYWCVEDMQGEVIKTGRHDDYNEACKQALSVFDSKTNYGGNEE